MAPHQVARLRLLALCVAVAARTALYAAVTVATVTALQNNQYAAYRPGTLAAWVGLCAGPVLLLSPIIGPLVGSRFNRAILIGGSLVVLAAAFMTAGGPETPLLSILGLLSVELAFFGPAVLAGVFRTARSARVSPTTAVWALAFAAAVGPWLVQALASRAEVSVPWLALAGASLAGVLLAGPRPSEPVSLGEGIVRPFLAGARGAFRQRRAGSALIGTWLLGFVALMTVVAVIRLENVAEFLRLDPSARRPGFAEEWIQTADWKFSTAIVFGVLFTGLNRHPYRQAGFVLYGILAGLAAILWLRFGESPNEALTLLGLALGLMAAPLVNFALVWIEPRQHATAAALIGGGIGAAGVLVAVLLNNFGEDPRAVRLPILGTVLAVVAVGLLAGIACFVRPMMELTVEVLFWPMYRIRSAGPDREHLPLRGPCLVIGNHAAWFDPLFLAKVLPAPITPMMTSKFYDLPVLAWLMRHVIGTIRVPDKSIRHEAPELKEAVAALDRGECIVLFPEGYLRRKEEVPLRRFGRGIWQILRDRPQTPVFACWIEGTWGSYLSFGGGPPAKGKRPDFWRSIRIGVFGPVPIDAATLKDHMTTRLFLMQQVSEARRPLGLEPLNLATAPDAEGDGE